MPTTPIDPAYKFVAVTPSDTAVLTYNGEPFKTKGIYVASVSTALSVENDLGDSVTFTDISPGVIHPISTEKILSSGTSATGIVALY